MSNKNFEINLIDLIKRLWERKFYILKIAGISAIIGLIIAFSIPKEYKTEVILAPEANTDSKMGNMNSIASMAGINLGSSNQDIIYPELFPEIVQSTPFIMGLFDLHVKDNKNEISTDLYSYFLNNQKATWWSAIIGFPIKLMKIFKSSDENDQIIHKQSNIIYLTEEQKTIINSISDRINVEVNPLSGIITLSVLMQSPEISVFIADTVTSYLQSYIINYRTEKARQDLDFAEKLYNESKADYYKAQKKYASFIDENINVSSALYKTSQDRLLDELNLAFSVYNQMSQQLQMAKIKVQDLTPVYAVIEPAVLPTIAESPKKKLIIAAFMILGTLLGCGIIIFKDFLLIHLK